VAAAGRKKSNEPISWQQGAEKAREARALVVAQLAESILERSMTGGRDHVARRLREALEAEGVGDHEVERAAVMELAIACAGWVVAIDLRRM
jgi:hypothetical protein